MPSAGWGDEGFDEDPFGSGTADVFGASVEDVDVWRNHDSFEGNTEWDEFNGESDHDDDRSDDRGAERGSRSSSSREHRGAEPRGPRRGRKPDKPRGSQHSSAPGQRPARRGSKSSDAGTFQDSDPRNGAGHVRRGSRSSGELAFAADPSNGGQRMPRRGSKSSDAHSAFDNDPFASDGFVDFSATSSFSSPTRERRPAVNDGFTDFSSIQSPPQSHHGFAEFGSLGDDGFGEFADFGNRSPSGGPSSSRSGHSNRSPRGKARTSAVPPRPRAKRTQSTDDIATHSSRSSASQGSRRSSHRPKVPNAATKVGRMLPSERKAKMESENRRGAIRDSLAGALGDEEDHGEVSLASFLGKESSDGRRSSRRSDTGSVQSAPAALKTHHRSDRTSRRRESAAGSKGDVAAHKSRRWSSKMSGSPQASPKEKDNVKEKVKIDLAALAEAGHLEVVDGKMRLVIDVET